MRLIEDGGATLISDLRTTRTPTPGGGLDQQAEELFDPVLVVLVLLLIVRFSRLRLPGAAQHFGPDRFSQRQRRCGAQRDGPALPSGDRCDKAIVGDEKRA